MPYPCKHGGEKVLLVEGNDDCHVVLALAMYHELPENFGLYECEGYPNILMQANALMLAADRPHTMGIVLDADTPGVAERWQAVKNKLAKHGYDFPAIPAKEGTVIEGLDHFPRLGVWLMPNNEDSGYLEDFLLFLADEDSLTLAETVPSERHGCRCHSFF